MPIYRQWYIVHRKEKRFTPIVKIFKEFVWSEAAAYVTEPDEEVYVPFKGAEIA